MRVFLSYSRRDTAVADRMVVDLEARGIGVDIDRRDLPYGEEWQDELAGFIRRADTIVWLASATSSPRIGANGSWAKRSAPARRAVASAMRKDQWTDEA